MNLSKYFTEKPLNKILEHHNSIYKLREVAGNREEKLKALQRQIDLLNTMNEGGKVKLKLPQDFVSYFLDDQDVDEIWAATRINKGISDKATILGDMRQVWKIFEYLDFVEDEETKERHKKENEGSSYIPPIRDDSDGGDDDSDEGDDDDSDGGDESQNEENKDDEKDDVLDDDDDDDILGKKKKEKKGPYFPHLNVQSHAFDQFSWNLNNINDLIKQRDYIANHIVEGQSRRRGSRSPNRQKKGGSGVMEKTGKMVSGLLFGGFGGGGSNDNMNDDFLSKAFINPSKRKEAPPKKAPVKKKDPPRKTTVPLPVTPPHEPIQPPSPPPPKEIDRNKNKEKKQKKKKKTLNRTERRHLIMNRKGNYKRPESNDVYEELKARGVHDSDYESHSSAIDSSSDEGVLDRDDLSSQTTSKTTRITRRGRSSSSNDNSNKGKNKKSKGKDKGKGKKSKDKDIDIGNYKSLEDMKIAQSKAGRKIYLKQKTMINGLKTLVLPDGSHLPLAQAYALRHDEVPPAEYAQYLEPPSDGRKYYNDPPIKDKDKDKKSKTKTKAKNTDNVPINAHANLNKKSKSKKTSTKKKSSIKASEHDEYEGYNLTKEERKNVENMTPSRRRNFLKLKAGSNWAKGRPKDKTVEQAKKEARRAERHKQKEKEKRRKEKERSTVVNKVELKTAVNPTTQEAARIAAAAKKEKERLKIVDQGVVRRTREKIEDVKKSFKNPTRDERYTLERMDQLADLLEAYHADGGSYDAARRKEIDDELMSQNMKLQGYAKRRKKMSTQQTVDGGLYKRYMNRLNYVKTHYKGISNEDKQHLINTHDSIVEWEKMYHDQSWTQEKRDKQVKVVEDKMKQVETIRGKYYASLNKENDVKKAKLMKKHVLVLRKKSLTTAEHKIIEEANNDANMMLAEYDPRSNFDLDSRNVSYENLKKSFAKLKNVSAKYIKSKKSQPKTQPLKSYPLN